MLVRLPTAVEQRSTHDRLLSILMIGIMLAGALLRLRGLDRTSIWNDEAASWSMARQPFWDMMHATAADTHPPLFNIILHTTIGIFGESEAALRLPSALMGIANIYLIYRLGTVLWNRLSGVFAAALLAFSSFDIWYSQEGRMYALLCLAATAYALTTVQYLSQPGRLRAALCGLAGLVLLYSHFYGILNWVGLNMLVALLLLTGGGWTRGARITWFCVQALAGLAFVPWSFVLLQRARDVIQDFWIPFPTPRFLAEMMLAMAGGIPMLLCLLVLVLIALWWSRPRSVADAEPGRSPSFWPRAGLWSRWQAMVLLSWAALPLLFGYAISLAGRPIVYDRYLIASLPPILLLAARGLSMLRSRRYVLAGAIVVLVAAGIAPLRESVAFAQREDFRSVVAVFAGQFRPSDAVVFASPGVTNTFTYYYPAPVAHEIIIHHAASDPVDLAGATRTWLFARDGTEVAPLLRQIEAFQPQREVYHAYGVSLYLLAQPKP